MTSRHQAQALVDSPIPRNRPRSGTPTIALSGGKGGVGKTLLAVNLAILGSRNGYRTLLVDLDPGLANVDVHCRIAPRHTLEDLARERCSPSEAIVTGPGGISLLAGQSGSSAMARGRHLPAVRRAIRHAARDFDLVVCDTGAGIGPAVMDAARTASLVLAVTTPDPAAATDTYALAKLLTRAGHPVPHLVVNRVRDRDQAMGTAARLSSVSTRFLGQEMPLAGWLRTDAGIERSVMEQRPFALSGRGPAMADLEALFATAVSATPGAQRSMTA